MAKRVIRAGGKSAAVVATRAAWRGDCTRAVKALKRALSSSKHAFSDTAAHATHVVRGRCPTQYNAFVTGLAGAKRRRRRKVRR